MVAPLVPRISLALLGVASPILVHLARRRNRCAQHRALEQVQEVEEMGCFQSKPDEPIQVPSKSPDPAPVLKPKVTVSPTDKAVLDLKIQRDKLSQYKRRLDESLDKEKQVALQLVRDGKRDRAALVIKRRKLMDGNLQNAESMLFQLEQLVGAIESKELESQFVDGVAEGTAALKSLNEKLRLEDVELLLEDSANQIQYQKDVAELVGGTKSLDEDEDIDRELEQMQKEFALSAAPEVPVDAPGPLEVAVQDTARSPEEKVSIAN